MRFKSSSSFIPKDNITIIKLIESISDKDLFKKEGNDSGDTADDATFLAISRFDDKAKLEEIEENVSLSKKVLVSNIAKLLLALEKEFLD